MGLFIWIIIFALGLAYLLSIRATSEVRHSVATESGSADPALQLFEGPHTVFILQYVIVALLPVSNLGIPWVLSIPLIAASLGLILLSIFFPKFALYPYLSMFLLLLGMAMLSLQLAASLGTLILIISMGYEIRITMFIVPKLPRLIHQDPKKLKTEGAMVILTIFWAIMFSICVLVSSDLIVLWASIAIAVSLISLLHRPPMFIVFILEQLGKKLLPYDSIIRRTALGQCIVK